MPIAAFCGFKLKFYAKVLLDSLMRLVNFVLLVLCLIHYFGGDRVCGLVSFVGYFANLRLFCLWQSFGSGQSLMLLRSENSSYVPFFYGGTFIFLSKYGIKYFVRKFSVIMIKIYIWNSWSSKRFVIIYLSKFYFSSFGV